MPVTTLSAAYHITPTVFKTFFEHSKKKGKKFKDGEQAEEATDDIFFDEAFHIVKEFIKMGTENTVESLQAFTNTHVPSPYWAAVSPVVIPLSSCNQAADALLEWFGPEDVRDVVGGERWWQVRGLDGVDGEWITEKEYLGEKKSHNFDRKLSDDEEDILKMDELESVMLYVHGGGYFWGSINTHRYQIIRYARKFKGRAFAVNYRKAPQYPWPCPLQDVIAAYLYLINPPASALHSPVKPSNIVFAGDSAGAGLSLTALTVLRDLGLPMPAGAVLISPWVDLTHSFPSVMKNTSTDIIPPHGFLAKPSTLWPIDLLPPAGSARVGKASVSPPPEPGHADTLRPSHERVQEEITRSLEGSIDGGWRTQTQKELLKSSGMGADGGVNLPRELEPDGDGDVRGPEGAHEPTDAEIEIYEPRPPKVLMKDPNAVPLELRSQIQLYAATEQLTHPLVSPVLQGSLGNLPPLYILAGNGEVLRDEIIYLAHKAAHPTEFPTRKGVLRNGTRQKENSEKFTTPTKVHLQVFDDMCHVLTVFSFTNSAKYAYRSIAEFVKHVTLNSPDHLKRNPFPELHRPISNVSSDSEPERHTRAKGVPKSMKKKAKEIHSPTPSPSPEVAGNTITDRSDTQMYKENERVVAEEVKHDETDFVPGFKGVSAASLSVASGLDEDVPAILMIRERVDIHGKARPMEPKTEVPALQLRPSEIGIIKEEPCMRWAQGQEEWDKRYKRSAERAARHRRRCETHAERMLANARDQGLLMWRDSEHPRPPNDRTVSGASARSDRTVTGVIQDDRRWGPLDLDEERPPLSAIAKRRDTPEALALLKKHIYHTAPMTHRTVPKQKTSDAIRAAFDPDDDPMKPPKQSVSEQQTRTHLIPIHGLRMWDAILGYFMRKTSKKAVRGTRRVAAAAQHTGEKLGFLDTDGKADKS